MKKKTMMMVIAALVLIGAGAFAAVQMRAGSDMNAVQEDAAANAAVAGMTETVENTETAETAQSVEPDASDASSEDMQTEIAELGGKIVEIADGYIVIEDSVHGMVQANLGDDTLYDGADLEEMAVGQYIQVLYDGKMTRSLPAQVYALKIGIYPVTGVVTALGEGSVTLETEATGEVIVFLPDGAPALAVGDSVTAYTNGAMTMSLPAQTSAIGVVKN